MRHTERLAYDWRFRLYPDGQIPEEIRSPGFDDSGWDTVRVPHDWAASGEFRIENDCSYSAVSADGITRPIEHSGRTGALPIVGCGVYRRTLFVGEDARGQNLSLIFDGIMWESSVYINGKKAADCHFGYKSFSVDITDYVEYGQENLVTVTASVYEDCSRWYPGAGIYRNVYFVTKSASHIPYSGVWVRQLEAANGKASFLLSVDYAGDESVRLRAEILSPDGNVAATVEHGTYLGELSDIFTISDVQLWDIDSPALYTARVQLLDTDGNPLDETAVRFGARNVRFDPDGGCILNGRKIKLNGVCNHHDLGSLGAAVNVAALRRQLTLMREMGVNAIRTSHNPPSPELLDLCDEMGFVVMDEFFDEWYMPKVKNGYAKYFRQHAETDVQDVIRRDRNHPSIILWSIGNEICEQRDKEGWRAAMMLSDTVHRTDPTRPTTAGFNHSNEAFDHFLAHFVDVVGLNYKPHQYAKFHAEHPGMVLLGSETESCVSTRGVYHLPAEVDIPAKKHDDLAVSAYDLAAPGWAYYAERELAAQIDHPYVAGEFIWTGMDYLGEPTPYYSEWPSRSSYFGVVDLAGLPKNRFYAYRAAWTEHPVLHVFPHWNWEGMEGQTVPVHVFTSYPEAELFVNGKSCGKRTFTDESEITRFRLMWNDVQYEPGEIKVVACDADGNPAAEKIIRTAGQPHHLVLTPERTSVRADGDDLVYIRASVVDKDGNLCPKADNRITFAVDGCGELLTTDAGDQRETESFARPDKKTLAGLLVACVRSIRGESGTITVHASADGLLSASAEVQAE